jgi:hypothetical protein
MEKSKVYNSTVTNGEFDLGGGQTVGGLAVMDEGLYLYVRCCDCDRVIADEAIPWNCVKTLLNIHEEQIKAKEEPKPEWNCQDGDRFYNLYYKLQQVIIAHPAFCEPITLDDEQKERVREASEWLSNEAQRILDVRPSQMEQSEPKPTRYCPVCSSTHRDIDHIDGELIAICPNRHKWNYTTGKVVEPQPERKPQSTVNECPVCPRCDSKDTAFTQDESVKNRLCICFECGTGFREDDAEPKPLSTVNECPVCHLQMRGYGGGKDVRVTAWCAYGHRWDWLTGDVTKGSEWVQMLDELVASGEYYRMPFKEQPEPKPESVFIDPNNSAVYEDDYVAWIDTDKHLGMLHIVRVTHGVDRWVGETLTPITPGELIDIHPTAVLWRIGFNNPNFKGERG